MVCSLTYRHGLVTKHRVWIGKFIGCLLVVTAINFNIFTNLLNLQVLLHYSLLGGGF
jgi:hypothetical protein